MTNGLIFVGFCAFVVALVVASALWLDSAKCDTYGDITGRDTHFSYISGCFVETDRGWFPVEQVYDQEVQR